MLIEYTSADDTVHIERVSDCLAQLLVAHGIADQVKLVTGDQEDATDSR